MEEKKEKRKEKRSWKPLIARGETIEEMLSDMNNKIAWCSTRDLERAQFMPLTFIGGLWCWPFLVRCCSVYEEMQAQLAELEPDCFDDGETPVSVCVLFEYQKEEVREMLMDQIKTTTDAMRKTKLLRILDRFDES